MNTHTSPLSSRRPPELRRTYGLLRALAVLALVVGFFAACDPPPVGMFASIERETKIVENNLSKQSYPRSIVRISDTYLVSLGPSIRYRDARPPADESDTPEWQGLSLPSGYDTVLGVFETSGGAAKAVLTNSSNSSSGIFEITFTDSEASFGEANELATAQQSERLQYAVELNGNIFVGYGSTSSGYSLYNATDDVSLYTDGALARDAVWTGSDYHFLLSDGRIYSSNTSDASGGTTAGADTAFGVTGIEAAVQQLVGMTYSGDLGGIVLTGETDGGDFVILDISDGSSIAPTNDDGEPVVEGRKQYTDLLYLHFADRLVVGVQDDGFLEVPIDGSELDFGTDGLPDEPTGDVYVTSDLSEASVTGFYVDTTAEPNLVFALTAGKGLWRGSLTDSGVLTWSWE